MKSFIAVALMVSTTFAYYDYNVSRDQKEIIIHNFDPSIRNDLNDFFNTRYKENRNPLMNKTVATYF